MPPTTSSINGSTNAAKRAIVRSLSAQRQGDASLQPSFYCQDA